MKRLLLLLLLANRLTGAPANPNPQNGAITITSITPTTNGLRISWSGGIPPYKLQTIEHVDDHWHDASYHIYANFVVISNALPEAYYRVRSIPDKTPPPALKGFGPRDIDCLTIRFSWDALKPDEYGGTGLRGTRIYRNGVFLYEVPAPMNVFIDTDAATDTAYTYWASAVDGAGNESARSGTRAVETLPCALRVTLSWPVDLEPRIAGYKLYMGLQSGAYTAVINVGHAHSYEVLGLMSGLTYYFVVTVYDASSLESAYSDEVSYFAQ